MNIAKHSLYYLMSKLAPAIFTMLTIFIFTRLLTPSEYGVYSVTILTAGFFVSFFFQWIILSVGRYLPASMSEDESTALIVAAKVALLLLCAALFAIFIAVEMGGFSWGGVNLLVLAFLICSKAWHDLRLKVLNAKLFAVEYGIVLAAKSMFAFFLGWVSIEIGLGVQGALVALSFGLVISTFVVSRDGFWRLSCNMEISQVLRMLKYGAPLSVTFLLVFVIDASDRYFLNYYLGSREVGIYSAAYDFTQYSIGTLLAVVHLAAFPVVMKCYAVGVGEGAKSLQKTLVLVLSVLGPACVGLAMIASDLGYYFFGKEFSEDAGEIMPLLTLGLFFSCLRSFYYDYAFHVSSRMGMQVYVMLLAAMTNLILNFILIPVLGMQGAALSTVFSFFVALVGSAVIGRLVFDMPSIDLFSIAKIVLSLVVMFWLGGWVVVDDVVTLILKIALCSLVYFFLALVMDLAGIRSYVSKIKVFERV